MTRLLLDTTFLIDTERGRDLDETIVDEIVAGIPIVPYDVGVAESHAELLAHDLIIAATARATSRAVITADVRAFDDLPDVVVHSH